LRKVWAGFSPLMNPRDRDQVVKYFVYAISYGPVLALGLCGLFMGRRKWKEFSHILILFGTFMGVSAIYWAHSRHRVFLDIYLIVFAVYAARRLLGCKTEDRLAR